MVFWPTGMMQFCKRCWIVFQSQWLWRHDST